MEKRIADLNLFKEYADFILKNRLDEFVLENVKVARDLQLPLLKHFENVPEEILLEISKQGIVEYLLSVVEDKIVETTEAATRDWKENRLPVISKEKLLAKDIALIYFIRKTTLFQLLPTYTNDLGTAIPLIKEIESYFSYQESKAIETFAEINNSEIEKREIRLKEAQSLAQLGCWDYDLQTKYIVWSEELYRMYGLDPKETITASRAKTFVLEEDIPPLLEKVRQVFEHGGSFMHEYRIRRVDGEIRTLVDKAYLEVNSGMKLLKGISQDITERKWAEGKLANRESNLEEAQAIAHLGSWEWDTVQNVVTWSDEMYRVFGYEPHEVQIDYAVYLSHIHPDDVELVKTSVETCYKNRIPYAFEHRVIGKNKEMRWLSIKGQVSQMQGDKVVKLSGIAMDVTERREIMARLEKSEQQFRLLSEYSSDVVTLIKPDGRFAYVSSACFTLLGYKTEEMIDTNLFDHVYADDLSLMKAQIEAWTRTSSAPLLEFRFKKKNGGYLWVETAGKSIQEPSGAIVEFRVSFRNISGRKKAEAQSEKNKGLLLETQEIANVGSFEWDLARDTSVTTPEVRRIFGQEEDAETAFKDFTLCLHPQDFEKVEAALRDAFVTGEYFCEYRIYREKDRQLRYVWVKGRVAFDEEKRPFKLTGSIMDITERKLAEMAIVEKTEALLASNRELEDFCHTISHDLRSPLRAIDGFAQVLVNQYEPVLDVEGKRLLKVICTNAQRMDALIHSLLEFSKLNKQKIKKYTFDMEALALSTLEECKDRQLDCKAVFHLGKLHAVPADKELIYLVWQNLFSNALKFSSKVGLPEITVGSEKKGDKVVYFVKDNGAGFEMRYMDKLFGVFQRLHSNKEFPGTGVGLATVQRIVQRHGGQVWAEGYPERGATFYFHLPLK